MSFTRKIYDQARSGLNSMMDRVSADDTPLSHVEGAALEAELAARKSVRGASPRKPLDNPLAKLAGASSSAEAQREKMAADREGRVRRERDAQAAAARKRSEEEFRQAKARAEQRARSRASSSSASSAGASSRGSSRGFPFNVGGDPLAEHYKTLDLQPGADLPTVKTAFRKLMRKYHPDLHTGNPKKQKAATELSMRVTQAYNELSKALNGK